MGGARAEMRRLLARLEMGWCGECCCVLSGTCAVSLGSGFFAVRSPDSLPCSAAMMLDGSYVEGDLRVTASETVLVESSAEAHRLPPESSTDVLDRTISGLQTACVRQERSLANTLAPVEKERVSKPDEIAPSVTPATKKAVRFEVTGVQPEWTKRA